MHLEQISLQFQKLSEQNGLNYSLGKAASEEEIIKAERKPAVGFPKQIKLFYEGYNGLYVEDPQLEVLTLTQLHFTKPYNLNFALVDGKHQIYFDTSQINEAEQWDIISQEGYLITKTIASFWSNKIWAWLKRRREIWKDKFPEQIVS